MDKLTEWLTKPFLDESVDLPIEIGDTVKMGKFKNKKVVVKKIDWNEKLFPFIGQYLRDTYTSDGSRLNL